MNKYSTGANNHATNDFVLTVVNDQELYNKAVINGWNSMTILIDHRHKQFKHMTDNDLDDLNHGFANKYFRSRKAMLDEEQDNE